VCDAHAIDRNSGEFDVLVGIEVEHELDLAPDVGAQVGASQRPTSALEQSFRRALVADVFDHGRVEKLPQPL
jgi:hypothetical protein